MLKNILKESIIMILLCAAIALILAVIFYDFIPINKVIPETITYAMPEELSEVKEELRNTFSDESENVVLTYEVTEEDLSEYKQTSAYKAGKANPFGIYKEEPAEENSASSGETNSTDNSSNGKSVENTNKNSTGTIFETGNTK